MIETRTTTKLYGDLKLYEGPKRKVETDGKSDKRKRQKEFIKINLLPQLFDASSTLKFSKIKRF